MQVFCHWNSLYYLWPMRLSLPAFLSFTSYFLFLFPIFSSQFFYSCHFTPYITIIITLATYLHNINSFGFDTMIFRRKEFDKLKFGQKINKIRLKIVKNKKFNYSLIRTHAWITFDYIIKITITMKMKLIPPSFVNLHNGDVFGSFQRMVHFPRGAKMDIFIQNQI